MAILHDQSLRQIVPRTMVRQVREAILKGILSGIFPPGHRLIEMTLAKDLGVSQSTVNQALQDLHAQGIVTKSLNKGTTVARFGIEDLNMLFAVRWPLERMACDCVARRMTSAMAKGLRNHVEDMREAAEQSNVPQFYLADYEFHQELYGLTCNPFLIQACEAIAAAPFVFILCGTTKALPADYRRVAEDHEDLVKALVSGPVETSQILEEKLKTWHESQTLFLEVPSQGLD